MQIQLTPYHARMIANNVDSNWNGKIDRRELSFKQGSKRLADYDRNGTVSTDELAYSLMRGDIYIANDRKAYPTYQRPGYGNNYPGYGYGVPPRPGYGYGQPPMPTAPGYPYQPNPGYGYRGAAQVAGTTVAGAVLGAGVGYAVGGSQGAGTGAAVGGILGFISNLFN